jgi:hypothetical protein
MEHLPLEEDEMEILPAREVWASADDCDGPSFFARLHTQLATGNLNFGLTPRTLRFSQVSGSLGQE